MDRADWITALLCCGISILTRLRDSAIPPEVCERLTGGKRTPEECIQAAFSFLLDREAKESILQRFDVTVISRYFPEFERELPRYFSPP
jgi:hypothetical protein